MYIVIVGAGRIGTVLADSLIISGEEVFMLDRNPASVERIRARHGGIARLGDGTDVLALREAGTSRADLFIAVTGNDADNLAACQLARHTFNVPKTICLCLDAENTGLFETLGIDTVVSVTDLVMSRLSSAIPSHPVVRLMPLGGRNRELVAVKVPSGALVTGRMVGEVDLPYGSSVVLIVGPNGHATEPDPETVINAEDQVIAVTPVESTQTLWETLTEIP